MFAKYDTDNNFVLSKFEFPLLIANIVEVFGGEVPKNEDVDDIFNLLDWNGDQALSKEELFFLFSKLIAIVQDGSVLERMRESMIM